MSPVTLYFSAGFAMFLLVMWDYNRLPATAKRLTRPLPPQGASQFAFITANIRNLTVMALFAFFLWPVVILWEVTAAKKGPDKKD